MIKNERPLKAFERKKLGFKAAVKIFTALWKEAVRFKVFPSKNPLEGIETDLKIARILNSCSKS
jgi:hypothetical protein